MPLDEQPTLQTIADMTGLSRSTVSRALRNDPMQSEATCKRVQKVAEEINYRPSPMVSALMTQLKRQRKTSSTSTLAMVNTSKEKDDWKRWRTIKPFVDGCKKQAENSLYKIDDFWLYEPGMTSKRLNAILHARGIMGLIVIPLLKMNAHLDLDISNFACATAGYSIKSPNMHRAARDFSRDIKEALAIISHRNYQRAGLVIPSHIEYSNDYHWSAGYLTYQQSLEEKDRLSILLCASFHDESGLEKAYLEFQKWFHKNKPDVIISYGDYVPAFLERMGLNIPDHVAYVDLVVSSKDSKNTGLYLDFQHVGAAAVDMVIGQINRNQFGEPDYAKLTLIHGKWHEGSTLRSE